MLKNALELTIMQISYIYLLYIVTKFMFLLKISCKRKLNRLRFA